MPAAILIRTPVALVPFPSTNSHIIRLTTRQSDDLARLIHILLNTPGAKDPHFFIEYCLAATADCDSISAP